MYVKSLIKMVISESLNNDVMLFRAIVKLFARTTMFRHVKAEGAWHCALIHNVHVNEYYSGINQHMKFLSCM